MIDVLVLISSILAGSLRVALCLFLIYRLLNTEHPTMKTFLIGLIGIEIGRARLNSSHNPESRFPSYGL